MTYEELLWKLIDTQTSDIGHRLTVSSILMAVDSFLIGLVVNGFPGNLFPISIAALAFLLLTFLTLIGAIIFLRRAQFSIRVFNLREYQTLPQDLKELSLEILYFWRDRELGRAIDCNAFSIYLLVIGLVLSLIANL